MERLDSTDASLKQERNDAAKSVELLAAREAYLQPTYEQIALLYADLHE
jgi:acetyl-CoA carboxylase/biotin carboxylase 1